MTYWGLDLVTIFLSINKENNTVIDFNMFKKDTGILSTIVIQVFAANYKTNVYANRLIDRTGDTGFI